VMARAPAILEVLDAAPDDQAGGLPGSFEVQFNPTEYSVTKGAQLAEIGIPGIDSPLLQFVRGQNERLTLELLFDTTAFGMGERAVDVKTLTNQIYQLVKIQPKTHAPPRVKLTWGQGLAFEAVVESVQQRFTLFSSSGLPLRATVSVVFREYKTLERQLKDLKLESSDHSRRVVFRRGDTLAALAAAEYGDAAQWRVIAERNRIDDPRRVRPGTELVLPPLEPPGLREGPT
jgi:Contractile injection system tube protein/LysM domain